MSNNEQKLAERFPSMREVWAPGTVTEKVESSPEPVDEPGAEPQVAPHVALRSADKALDVARHELRLARDTLARARETVGKCLAAYNAATPTITPEQNIRDHLRGEQERKAQLAAAGRGRYQPSVTETARAMSGGGYGRDKRAMRGGGRAYARGAFSKAQAATINAQQIRAANEAARMNGSNAPRVKLPSER